MKKKLSLSDYFDKKLESCGFSGLLIGLSGGADSVGLILLLANSKIYCKGELKIKALHCNFNLRGEESMRDEQFCIDLCAKLGVELEVVSFRAREEALRRGVSIEVACRDLRYEYFRKKYYPKVGTELRWPTIWMITRKPYC